MLAALELFSTREYDEVTVAEIAERAGVSTRTFFGYFRSKEDVLFADTRTRTEHALRSMAERVPGESPVDMLVRAVRDALLSAQPLSADPGPSVHDLHGIRLRLNRSSPQVQAAVMRRLQETQVLLSRSLLRAFPERLTGLEASALVGAFVGAAVNAVLFGLAEDPDLPDAARVSSDAVDVVRHRLQELDRPDGRAAQREGP